jgi:O-antigen/teichoic acid export membrane protein
MSRSRYLLKNMSLFTISNMASKILVFLLVPLYTNVLSEADYGVADVMQTTLLLLVPFLSVNAGEAALRYGIECSDKRGSILRSGMRHVLRSVGLVAAGCVSLSLIFTGRPELRGYFLVFILLYAADAVYEFMLLYTQGSEKVEIMISGSICCTFVTVISNIVLLLVFKAGLYGYLFSQIAAFCISSVLMFVLVGGGKLIKSSEDAGLKDEMTVYGRGMLLYSTASWANNAIDRYFILFMLGAVQNGLYGVAYKIPAILMVCQRIFAQSFQMSATKEYREEDSGRFFGELYELYNAVMLVGCAMILLCLKPLAYFMFRKGFYGAWIMVPPLLISVIFGALEGYLGSICLAHKDGKSMGIATGVGALVNIILNFVAIRMFGAMGAAFATMISYFTMFAIARYLTGKHVALEVNIIRNAIGYVLILLAGGLTMYLGSRGEDMKGAAAMMYAADALTVAVLALMYRKQFAYVVRRITKRGSAEG